MAFIFIEKYVIKLYTSTSDTGAKYPWLLIKSNIVCIYKLISTKDTFVSKYILLD